MQVHLPSSPSSPAPSRARVGTRGFSLLEVMMVMFILALLLGAVFGIVRGTLELSNDMTEAQLTESRVNGFAQYCERTLRNLPASALVRLRTKQQGNHYLSQLTLKGVPSAFAGQAGGGKEVTVLETEEQVDGYLRVMLRSMSATEALAWEKGNAKAGRRLLLLENVAKLEWAFYRVQSGEWEPVWNERTELFPLGVVTANPSLEVPGGIDPPPGSPPGLNPTATPNRTTRPQLAELRLTMAAGTPQRWLFWVPPAETPSGGSSPTSPVVPPPDSPLDPVPDPAPAPVPPPDSPS